MIIVKLEGIPGQYPGNKCEPDLTNGIEVSSISWGSNIELSGSGGSFSTGTVRFNNITFSKGLDKATGPLMAHCASGMFIKNVRIYYVRTGAAGGMYVFGKWELNDVIVSGYTLSGDRGSGDPIESISFSPSKLAYTYFEMKPNGQVGPQTKGGWDMKVSKAI